MVTFTDRVPTYPGRVRLTPVTGQTNVYDLTREDDPVVAGTPLNAALFQAFGQVEIGSYTGAGSPTTDRTLTFSFRPDAVFVVRDADTYTKIRFGMMLRSGSHGFCGVQTSSTNSAGGFTVLTLTWSDNSVTFRSDSATYDNLDAQGATYVYVALGRGV